MSETIRQLLTDLKARLAALYGPRLCGLYLFGSYARGEADEESDADVLIVLDHVERYSDEIERTSELISALSLSHGVSISRVFASEAKWRDDRTAFFVNVREEAIPA
jgi:predicted nucleotidyltransferase